MESENITEQGSENTAVPAVKAAAKKTTKKAAAAVAEVPEAFAAVAAAPKAKAKPKAKKEVAVEAPAAEAVAETPAAAPEVAPAVASETPTAAEKAARKAAKKAAYEASVAAELGAAAPAAAPVEKPSEAAKAFAAKPKAAAETQPEVKAEAKAEVITDNKASATGEKSAVRFDSLNLSAEVQRAITEMGYEEASAIQAAAIPALLAGRDVIGQAQTGTGKTAAFSIPAIEGVDGDSRDVQVLVLCPTRELAVQVSGEIQKLGKYKRGLMVVPIYGGAPYDRQLRALERGVQIVIGTPGRVMDHIERGTLRLDKTTKIILDEADEMLDMGFRDDIEFVLSKMPKERQTVFFSATMSKPIMELTRKYQHDPEIVKVNHQTMTVTNIEQSYFEVRGPQKKDVLTRIIDMYNLKSTIVFANTKRMVDEIVADLQAKGNFAEGLHGDMGQQQRQNTLDKFRKGTLEVLVATDVAARGIDVDNVEAVFNYDLPADEEYYVHRIGRTGRAGKSGKAFTFVSGRDIYKLRDIMRFTKAQIKLEQVPSFADVSEVKTTLFLNQIKEIVEKGNLEKYVGRVQRLLDQSEDITSLDIAAALLKMTMKEDKSAQQSLDASKAAGSARPGYTRLFITMGKKDRLHPRDIVDLISESSNMQGGKVGDIALYDKFSFVEVPSEFADEIVAQLGRTSIQGRPVSFSIATPVQETEAKAEGFNRTGGPGDRDRERGPRPPFGGGDRREGGSGYGGGYKGNRDGGGGSSYGSREGGSGYGGGYKGNRDSSGGSGYGSKPAYGDRREGGSGYGSKPAYGDRREGGSSYGSKPAYGNKASYGDKPAYGDRPAYGDKPAYGSKPPYGNKGSRDNEAPRPSRNDFDE